MKPMGLRTDEPAILAPKLPLSILLLEDNPDDAELCLRVLRKAHLDVCLDVVTRREEFTSRASTANYDVILADYNLGCWTGMDALQIIRDQGYEIPFILVTGALGEQKAVECIKKGIADYILKDRLERLPVAILRVVEERGLHAEHDRMEHSLHENEAKFRTLAETIPVAIFIEEGTRCCYANRAAEKITGYSREELLSTYFWQLLLPDSRDAVLRQTIQNFEEDESTRRYEIQILTRQNKVKPLNVTVKMFPLGGRLAALITALEIEEPRGRTGKICKISESNFQSAKSELRSISAFRLSRERLSELELPTVTFTKGAIHGTHVSQ
jgi:PAS domain S-box-containing protein